MVLKNILLILTGVFFTIIVVYFTPIRYTDLIEPTINDISATEFYQKYTGNTDDYIFIDVRGKIEYDLKHAEGAISMPLHTLFQERHNLPKKGKEIVLICKGGSASGVGYSYLEHFGFTNIARIEGGIDAWSDAGLPTVIDIGI